MIPLPQASGIMKSTYLPYIPGEAIVTAEGDSNALFDLLVEPLHEELYRRQDFSFMDELTEGQQLFLAYDYLRAQVLQGGFLQFLVNDYVGLLPEMPGWLSKVQAQEMAEVIDDVLKVFVLNIELLDKETTTQEFAGLYEELKEFQILDDRFTSLHDETMNRLAQYAKDHLNEFATVVETS